MNAGPRIRAGSLLLAVLLIVAGFGATHAERSRPSLPFRKGLSGALERGLAEDKPVVVAFVAAWCPTCTEMRASVFRDPRMIEIADDFIWVLVDIDRQVTLGFKWELRDRGTLEAGLVENFISFDNTPDVAFHFGFTQRL